ncbi:MAG: hypothetical protein PHR36_04990 [Patescibacteria group bacterium]|nr:hypothetical protein [Patescibacteria group bacterium]
MEDKIEISGILFFALFIIAGAIAGVILFPNCWWLSLPAGGLLGILLVIIIFLFVSLAVICILLFILLFILAWFLLKSLAGATKRFIKKSTRRIATALHII